jgi:hypothetical protein
MTTMVAFQDDEMREDRPMLHPGTRFDSDQDNPYDLSSDDGLAERQERGLETVSRRGRTAAWQLLLGLCCISFFALSGVMLSHFFDEPPLPAIPDSPSSTPTLSPTPIESPGSNAGGSMRVNLTQSEQLDLKTGFVISGVPTTREYVFNITRERSAPDGFEKPMILVNGQSPGPLLEANTGDVLRITVNNLMPQDSTTIHWHGIDQRNSNWMDGVHGVTQCSIPPGQSFTYEFNVTGQRGTFWYHSHISVQYTNGLFGPLVRSHYIQHLTSSADKMAMANS